MPVPATAIRQNGKKVVNMEALANPECLTEYENIAILYACSLDYMRLAAYYRGLCKTEIDKIFATTIESFSSTLPSNYPVFNFSESVPSKFSLTKTIPQFVFNKDLPTNVSLTKSLPSSISITNPF